MGLLREVASDGFPTDYLLARVRARRAELVGAFSIRSAPGGSAETTDEAIWEAMLQEFAWLYRQMNRSLRSRLEPVFVLFELKTLVLCLRNKAAQRPTEVERLLMHSLLADGLQDPLRGKLDVPAAVAGIAVALGEVLGSSRALETAYTDGGLMKFESRLIRGYLEHVVGARLHKVVRRFFVGFIDLRNLMALYKHLRWEVDEGAAFIRGGTIEPSRLRQASARRDAEYLDTIVGEIAGRAVPSRAAGEIALESVLLGSLSEQLRKAARRSEDVGPILEYVWRLYVVARNRAVLLHAGDLGAGTLERELIA